MQSAKDTHKKNKKSLKPLIIIAVAIVIIFGVIAALANNVSGIYPNTYVNGKNISTLTEKELNGYISKVYTPEKLYNQTISFECNDNKVELKGEDLGITFNNDEFTKKILSSGKDGNFFANTIDYIARWFKPFEVTPVINYNETVLDRAMNDATAGYETEPVGYTFKIEKDTVTIHNCIDGVKADRQLAIENFKNQVNKLKLGTIYLNPVPVSPDPLDFDEFYKWLTSDAQEAYYEKVDGKVIVRDSKPKCEVDRQAVKTAIQALENSSDSTVTISVKTTEPESTSEKLAQNLYKDKLGSYSTYFGSSAYARANNVRLATSRLNNIELMPGEVLSYDKTILPRTTANGYMPAGVYVGNKSEIGMGGGICQPSSTLYAAALYANLEIIERHHHSLPVSYLPAGLDATIAEGYLDLVIKNNTDYPVKIVATANGGVVDIGIYGYNDKNISVVVERSFSNGRHYVTRVVKEDGLEIKREPMTSSIYGVPEKDEPEEEENPEEENPEGENPEGENSEGENPEGENPEGENPEDNAQADASTENEATGTEEPSTDAPISDKPETTPSVDTSVQTPSTSDVDSPTISE